MTRMNIPAALAGALAAALAAAPAPLAAQTPGGLDPATLTQPLEASWPTCSGDYTGRRYSLLRQVTTGTVQNLTLAWTRELDTGMPPLDGPRAPTFTGGEGTGGASRTRRRPTWWTGGSTSWSRWASGSSPS